jgi:MFS family permease
MKTFGSLSTFLAAVARGGPLFMLIIWLQGIWLPLHGYSFTETPLWAGIYMLPLTLGILIAGPISGLLSDRYGARPFATGGMIGAALSFAMLIALPTDFTYWVFAAILFFNGVSMGMFAAPFRAGLDIAFTFAILACLVAAAASMLRGGRYHHAEESTSAEQAAATV